MCMAHKKEAKRSLGRLKFILYSDDTNILPSHDPKSKYCYIYCSLGDLPYHQRRNIDNITIIGMIKRRHLTLLPFKKRMDLLWSPYVDELKILHDFGINVNGKTYKATVIARVGDNLDIYEFFGFGPGCFPINRFSCRLCGLKGMCTCEKIYRKELELFNSGELEDVPIAPNCNFDQCPNLTNAIDPFAFGQLSDTYFIERTDNFSPLDKLNLGGQYAPLHIGHDLPEGVLKLFLTDYMLPSMISSIKNENGFHNNLTVVQSFIQNCFDKFKLAEGKIKIHVSSSDEISDI
ncbi:hypothetical protein BLOT_012447 [Blomia tropicalis]|nr:hypothetical protein BLOT_012447 [Blomia tropicalis]